MMKWRHRANDLWLSLGFWIPGNRFWIPFQWNLNSRFQSLGELWISWLDFGFQSSGYRIPKANLWFPGFRITFKWCLSGPASNSVNLHGRTRKWANWWALLSPSHRVHSPALAIPNLGMLKRCLEEQEPKDRGTGDSGSFICTWGLSSLNFLIPRPPIVFSIPLFIRHFKNSLILIKKKQKELYLIKPRLNLRPIFQTKKPSNINFSARMSWSISGALSKILKPLEFLNLITYSYSLFKQ